MTELITLWVVFCLIDLLSFCVASRIQDRVAPGWDEWASNKWRHLPGSGIWMLQKYWRLSRK